MAFDWSVRQSGVWHRVATPYAKVAGVWKGIFYAWVHDAGAWRLMHSYVVPEPIISGATVFSCTDPGCGANHTFTNGFMVPAGRNLVVYWTRDGSLPSASNFFGASSVTAGVFISTNNTLNINQSILLTVRARDTLSGYYSPYNQVTLFYSYTPATGTAPGTPVINYSPGGVSGFECSQADGCPASTSWTVTLTSSGTAPVTHHYTTDGSTPTTGSPALANGGSFTLTVNRPPLNSRRSTVLNVKAFNASGSSAVASKTFFYQYDP